MKREHERNEKDDKRKPTNKVQQNKVRQQTNKADERERAKHAIFRINGNKGIEKKQQQKIILFAHLLS